MRCTTLPADCVLHNYCARNNECFENSVKWTKRSKYGLCIRVRIKPEVFRLMTRQAQKQAIRLAAGERAIVHRHDVYANPKVIVVYQHNLNEFMDYMHGGHRG